MSEEKKRRKKRIPWDLRIRIFLCWRVKGNRVYPVANELSVGRATVRNIRDEFVDMGFSASPRLSLPEGMLIEAQEAHLNEMMDSLSRVKVVDVEHPGSLPRELDQVSDLGEELDPDLYEVPTRIDPMLSWHLRDTPFGAKLSLLEKDINDYDIKRAELWKGIADVLLAYSGLPLVRISVERLRDEAPCIFNVLVHKICQRLFRVHDPRKLTGGAWPIWGNKDGNEGVLLANHGEVAIGCRASFY